MERERLLADLHGQIETLAMLHIRHRLENTESFLKQKAKITHFVQIHSIDVRSELDPVSRLLYRRYFG